MAKKSQAFLTKSYRMVVCVLDKTGKTCIARLPDSVMQYIGLPLEEADAKAAKAEFVEAITEKNLTSRIIDEFRVWTPVSTHKTAVIFDTGKTQVSVGLLNVPYMPTDAWSGHPASDVPEWSKAEDSTEVLDIF